MTDATRLLPQQATHANALVESVDWLIEPYWSGDRLLASLNDGRVSMTDAQGDQVDEEFVEAAALLVDAIDADAAVIDGIWTAQPDVGNGAVLRRRAAMIEAGRYDEAPDPIEVAERPAFVAIDLVDLEGVSLHDVPYQERRRLLESVLRARGRVRISPAVRLPFRPWLDAWRNDGFVSYVAKHVNSRYRPGQTAQDWLVLSLVPEKVPSVAGRLFGERPRKRRRIED
jgi:bifunctional non-homologous end joining protein LigD